MFDELQKLLERIFQEAKNVHPGIELSLATFSSFVAERISKHSGQKKTEEIRAGDLYLACACSQGDQTAIFKFQEAYQSVIQSALLRLNLSAALVDDVKQRVYQKLFVKDGDSLPKIAQYTGEGDLRSWVRVIAIREALNLLHQNKQELPISVEALIGMESPVESQELIYMKGLYRKEFRQAFHYAFGTLTSRERNILRHYLLDGLSFDEIGRLYNVHQTTVGRWMEKIRQALFDYTRQTLAKKLQISRPEFESIIRLIHSQMDVSIHRFLKEEEE